MQPTTRGLTRRLGLLGLAATGICSMLGAGINVVPFMLQRNVPGIGPHVLPAYFLAAVPALLAALAYAALSSAMPRAGGSYVFASRSLSPYLGFVASFSQWFGLSIVIGVVSYLLIPFFRDIAAALGLEVLAGALDQGWIRVALALAILWFFVWINLHGIDLYERTLVPLMFLMFALGAIVIVAGFAFDQPAFLAAVGEEDGVRPPDSPPLSLGTLLAATAVLFSSFIGFDSIAQAGGEAKHPRRNLPLAVAIAVLGVGAYYLLFTAAVYHAVPWEYIAREAMAKDLTAPGLLGELLSPGWTVAIVAGAAIALMNDLPAMLLSVSRLVFAWAEDGVFPSFLARVHPRRHTPTAAILLSGTVASAGILGSHLAGDFFLGVDILVVSMLVNFLLMCLSLLALPRRQPALAAQIGVMPWQPARDLLALLGALMLGTLLAVHAWKDLTAPRDAWYFHSVLVWLLVMAVGSLLFYSGWRRLKARGVDVAARYSTLPEA